MRITILWALGALVLLPACGPLSCTEIGCLNGASIDLVGPQPAGVHTLTVTADGLTQVCTFDPSALDGVDCDRDDVFELGVIVDDRLLVRVLFEAELIELELVHDGQPLLQETVEPEYVESAPNGEACGPICFSSSDEIRYGS